MHWAKINEVSCVLGMKMLLRLYLCLGKSVFRLIVYPLVFFYVLTQKTARAASIEYLHTLKSYSGNKFTGPLLLHVIRHFYAFAESILDKLLIWSGHINKLQYTVHGFDSLKEQLKQGRGGLLLVSHIGNSDLTRALVDLYKNIPLTILVHTRHAEKFNRLLANLGSNGEVNLYQVADFSIGTAMALSEKISKGELLAIAGDRVPLGEGGHIPVKFMGRSANLPIGPYVLAASLACPLFSLMATKKGRTYHVRAELLADQVTLERSRRFETIQEMAQKYTDVLERECLFSPYQWFNFYPFWNQQADNE